MEMHSPFPALRDFHLKVKRLTMICASLALLHPLLSLTHWIFGSLMLPYKSSSRSAKYVRWCDSCSLATPMQRAELNTARQSSHKSPARDDGAGGPPIVISTEAKRSEEISFLAWYMKHGGGRSLDSEYHERVSHLPHTDTQPRSR